MRNNQEPPIKDDHELTTADHLAMEAADLLAPHCIRLKINVTITGFPPYTLPDELDRKCAYLFVSGGTKDKDDWAVIQVKEILERYGFRTERYSDREIRILGRSKSNRLGRLRHW
jgi:hypothetical protein